MDAHDHTAGKGVQIPIAALSVNADFNWLNFGQTNIGYAAFTDKLLTANMTVNQSLANVAGDPYWRNASGVVKKIGLAGDALTITSGTAVLGSLLFTAIGAPTTPAAGKASVYVDSTSKNLAVKNDAGTVNHGIQTKTAVASNWLRSIADDGSSVLSQPAFTDLSGAITTAQLGTNTATNAVLAQMATLTLKGNNTGGTANALDLTVAQVNAILPVFTSVLNGSTPLSGGGTTNFLRADGTWQVPVVAGRLIGVQVIKSGTTYTKTAGTNAIIVEGWGAGGGGGGTAATGAATSAAGGGGGSGGYFLKRVTGLGAGPFTIAIGVGGTGVSGGAGNNGTATTFNDGTTTYSANGGTGGALGAAVAVVTATLGGAGATSSGTGDANGGGNPGGWGLVMGTTTAIGGIGGVTSLGGAGQCSTISVNGTIGVANTGCGGGGQASNNAGTQQGQAGGSGQIIVWEFT